MVQQKYYRVSEVAKILGLSQDKVREYCHVKRNSFAFRVGQNGKFMIDLEKLRAYIERPKESRDIYIFTQKEKRKFG